MSRELEQYCLVDKLSGMLTPSLSSHIHSSEDNKQGKGNTVALRGIIETKFDWRQQLWPTALAVGQPAAAETYSIQYSVRLLPQTERM